MNEERLVYYDNMKVVLTICWLAKIDQIDL